MSKKVVVLTTGGTIAMKLDPEKGVVPAVSGQDLVDAVPGIGDVCAVEVREFSNIPSPHMTPGIMFRLSRMVGEILADEAVLGVVITHGTDTVEETAYLLDLTCPGDKPVVLTAAMRSAAEISPDGPKNILCAVQTAASPAAHGLGALVVLNEEIHAAREVTKTHSANVATFSSGWWGPLGYVDEGRVVIRRKPVNRQHICPKQLGDEVYLLKATTSNDTLLFDTLVDKNVAGIILEGFGRGNVPPAIIPCIEKATAKGIPVVLTTRTLSGRVLDVYGYVGGVVTCLKAGAILGGELSGPKARLKLMLALGLSNDRQELAKYFDVE